MRKLLNLSLGICITILMFSCTKDKASDIPNNQSIPEDVLTQIAAKGFSNIDVSKTEGGYIVEGDIFIPNEDLPTRTQWQTLDIATEQYRTNNLVAVTGTSRTITLQVSSKLPSAYVTAMDEVVRRFNAENLTLKFARVNSGGNIFF